MKIDDAEIFEVPEDAVALVLGDDFANIYTGSDDLSPRNQTRYDVLLGVIALILGDDMSAIAQLAEIGRIHRLREDTKKDLDEGLEAMIKGIN